MPGLTELPGWLWRKTSRRAKLAVAAVALLLLCMIPVLGADIRDSNRQRAADERRRSAAERAERIRHLRAEQRPHSSRSSSVDPLRAGARRRLAARAALLDDVERAVLADARRRVRAGALTGRVSRATCEPFPRTVNGVPHEKDLSKRGGRYACLAVTAEFKPGAASRDGGVIGHPYRVLLDFTTGRFTYCKTTGVTGPSREHPVTIPPACGGRPDAG